MPVKDKIDNGDFNQDLIGNGQTSMTDEEKDLRDSINQYLSLHGYHLQLSYLRVTENEFIHNFVEPIHEWFYEFPAVFSIVTKKIHEWQAIKYDNEFDAT